MPQQAGARIVVVDPWRQWPDPSRVATEFHHSRRRPLAGGCRSGSRRRATPSGCEAWRTREERAQAAIAGVLGTDLSEPQVARAVHRFAAAHDATIVVSASMPIRDLEWFSAAEATPPRVLANRGANGIDGVVSTALGVAASVPDRGRKTDCTAG